MLVVVLVVVCLALAAARLRLDRGRLAAARASSTSRSTGFQALGRRSDRAPLGLPPRRPALAGQQRGASARCAGSRSAGPTSSASPATSSPTPVESLCCGRCSPGSTPRSSSSETTTWPSRAIPFSKAAELRDLERTRLLRDEAVTVEVRGARSSIVGVDPETYRVTRPRAARARRAGGAAAPALPLSRDRRAAPAGLVRPDPRRAISTPARSASRSRDAGSRSPTRGRVSSRASTRRTAGVMHVSPGTGTTFVPFRFFARPEVTELVLCRKA